MTQRVLDEPRPVLVSPEWVSRPRPVFLPQAVHDPVEEAVPGKLTRWLRGDDGWMGLVSYHVDGLRFEHWVPAEHLEVEDLHSGDA